MDVVSLVVLVAFLAVLFSFLWKVTHSNFDHFKKRGIPYLTPHFPFGSFWPVYSPWTEDLGAFVRKAYNSYPNAKIVGLFDFQRPLYLIRDPELIKQIAVRDFEYFSGK